MDCDCRRSTVSSVLGLFWFLVTYFAIYLSFKCNGGFYIGSFLAACCCSPLYIAYKLGTASSVCFPSVV